MSAHLLGWQLILAGDRMLGCGCSQQCQHVALIDRSLRAGGFLHGGWPPQGQSLKEARWRLS